jgi:hypothetical protein
MLVIDADACLFASGLQIAHHGAGFASIRPSRIRNGTDPFDDIDRNWKGSRRG